MTRSLLVQPISAALLLLALALAAAAPNPAAKKDDPHQLTASHAILIDAESGAVLYEKAPDQLFAPASLTKLCSTRLRSAIIN
jgi:serine-type D-Ala-D-Ala carboxypeptidase (penicillin-binding protein 5/6)